MHGLRHISGFIVLAAILVGGAGCSDDQAQQVNGSAVGGSSDEEKPKGEVVEISLAQIWALRMPGTRDIHELERKHSKLTGQALVDELLISLINSEAWIRQGEVAGPGFAVLGKDLEALRGAHEVLVEGKKPRESFSTEDDLSLVFFSYGFSGRHVSLRKAQRQDSHIEIQYRGDPYNEQHFSPRIALIPLGRLASGKYRVEFVQLPMDKKFVEWGFKPTTKNWDRQFVSNSFSFSVERPK